MTPERWLQIRDLLHGAMQLKPAQRPGYLELHCSSDPSLRKDVDSFLATEERMKSSFLDSPALAQVACERKTDSLMVFSVGAKFGPYEIQSLLGAGGMGEVYRARDTRLNRTVAVKVLPPYLSSDPVRQQRFEREARAISALQHPNICTLYDVGQQSGIDYMTMECLEGETLASRLRTGPLPLDRILRCGIEVADALDTAHRQGIVHRDLKTENIFLTSHGECKVLDFGLAMLEEVTAAVEMPTVSRPAALTGTGTCLGTVAYMSPEQARGESLDARTDIFSLGAVLYELATGKPAFPGKTTALVFKAIMDETPSAPTQLNPGLPVRLDEIISKALEKDRNQRYQHSSEIRTDVQRLKRDSEGEHRAAAGSGTVAIGKAPAVRAGKIWKITVPVLLLALLLAGGIYYRSRQTKPLTDKDTIALADFANSTGDPVFDDTLKTALSISLRQSPFLDVLSNDKVTANLKMMNRPANAPLTPDVARELCERANSKAYVAGSIASLGSQYVLGLKAVNCQNGDTLAQEQVAAATKEKVLDALAESASKLRGHLGESLATVRKFDVTLEQATTSSLEALRAYSLGSKADGPAAALPHHLRAIQLDPNFAMGYRAVGADYWSLGETGLAEKYYAKAFELREHASAWEELTITAGYHWGVTGELAKAAQAYRQRTESYPRDSQGYGMLGIMYASQGQYAAAMEATREGLRLDPTNFVPPYVNYLLASQRFDEARQMIQQAQARKADPYILHNALYALAFLGANSQAMADQQRWFASHPDYEDDGLSLAADTEAYAGRLGTARELTKHAVQSAIRAETKENAAIWLENAALREAAFGHAADAKASVAEGLKMAPTGRSVGVEATLALAMAGDAARAETMAQHLNKRFPLDTQVQFLWLPAIQAQLALDVQNPAAAIDRLQAAAHVELAEIQFITQISCLYPLYLRGQAYLLAGQSNAAATEFQKILDHSGIVWNCWTGALAHLGIARANALQSRTSQGPDAQAARVRALAAYKVFLTLWKDADPDIPILKKAKAEYAKLK